MIWRCLTLLVLLLCVAPALCQEVEDEEQEYTQQWIASFYLDVAVPLQQFDRNMREAGVGVGGELLYNIQYQAPVWAGLGVHTFSFDDYSLVYGEIFDGEYFEYKDITASRLFIAHAIFRFQPTIDFILQPYFQGGFGMHWFFTNTKVEDTEYDEVIDRINENQDSAFGYSLHAGIHIVPPRKPEIRGDIRIGYFKNPSVEYMRYNSELGGVDGLPIDYFETRVSAVDALGVHAGVSFLF